MKPAEGERSAVVGFSGQYGLAARVVHAKLRTLEWIRVADPAAGVADDFQFKAGPTRHALQVKWSQYPGSFSWGALVNPAGDEPALLWKLARAWERLRETWDGPLAIHLRSNDYASTAIPQAGTPLAAATIEGPRHFAAFLARAFEPVRRLVAEEMLPWSELAARPEVADWSSVWDALRLSCGLDDGQFVTFVRDFTVRFSPPVDDPLLRSDDAASESEIAALAAAIQALVADPSRPLQLSREQLLGRLGWSDRLQYRHPHRFPVPALYTANASARADLETRLEALTGGYLALVGPAGCGKSTLLSSLNLPGRVVRYYAFVPDAPDPLSGRGEADSFLHDLSLALEEGGLSRGGYANDLASRRTVLQRQLDQAGRRWRERGETTVIVVDGLDHIPREQHPTRSLLQELPGHSAIPDGVFLILGTQTTAILPAPVRDALERDERTVDVPPLSADEINQLTDLAGVGAWLWPGQRDDLVRASEGHPLSLTYLLAELAGLEQAEPDAATRRELAEALLRDVSAYGGDVEERYRGYFQAVGDNREVLDLLGVVARLRAPVELDWLAAWADGHAVTAFAERTAAFFHRDGTEWRFIHNSFRRFLADATAQVAGRADGARDRALHVRLADLCAVAGDRWPLYRDEELAHRYLAGQFESVLELSTPDRLRHALLDLFPFATVRDHALLGLRAAADLADFPAYLRMLLFHSELGQREQVLEPEKLADAVLRFVPPAVAMQHVTLGAEVRVSDTAALRSAAQFAAAGHADLAQQILKACGGLPGLLQRHGSFRDRDTGDAIADWAEATWHLTGQAQVLALLDHHLPHPHTSATEPAAPDGDESDPRAEHELRERQATTAYYRNLVHAKCFDLLLSVRDTVGASSLLALIDVEASHDWRARARVVLAKAALEDMDQQGVLRWVGEVQSLAFGSSPDEDDDEEQRLPRATPAAVSLHLRIAAAELLVRAGHVDAPEVVALVPVGTRAPWPSDISGRGLQPFETVIRLRSLREVCPDPTPVPSSPDSGRSSLRDAGTARFREALDALAALEGQELAAAAGRGEPPVVHAHAEPIVRLLEVPQRQSRDWTGWYIVRGAAPGVMQRLVRLATRAGGATGLGRVLSAFDRAWTTFDRASHWSIELQQEVVLAALREHADAEQWARHWLERFDTEIDARAYDPHDRATTWLRQSRAWCEAGDPEMARVAAQRAVRASLGAGYHDDDRQLVTWLDWLAAGKSGHTAEQFQAELRAYASRIVAAAGEAENQAEAAAERLLALAWGADPPLAVALAESFCDKGVLGEADAIQALVVAAARDSAVPVMLGAAVAAHLLLPIVRNPSPDVLAAVAAREGADEAVALIEGATRVWTVPEDRSDDEPEPPAPSDTDADELVAATPRTPGALLAALRAAPDASMPSAADWDGVVAEATVGVVPPAMAGALLEQASRLRLSGWAIGSLAALAARSGNADAAAKTLADALARTPASGWLRFYDGGSRVKIFAAALRDRHPVLVSLAANDLAGSLASGALRGHLHAEDLRRVSSLIGGDELVASAWPDVVDYIDQLAPIGEPVLDTEHQPVPAASASEALLRWVVQYLGHPVRPLDFGARRVLQIGLRVDPTAAQTVLSEAIAAGGWRAEAALLALVTAKVQRLEKLSPELQAAATGAATGGDAIGRDLARRFLTRYGCAAPRPTQRELPTAYRLALPPLPERGAPELDAEGAPHLDPHDPQDQVAPFDLLLSGLAEASGIERSTVLHRAAAVATAQDDPWLRGGHRAQRARLNTRGQRHTHRPWAYMAGRRAAGVVLAELLDSGSLGQPPRFPAYALGILDERLVHVVPEPLDASTPMPWRREKSSTYDVRGWCDETVDAAQVYASAAAASMPYVLAEHSEWRGLEWGHPEEVRQIRPIQGERSEMGLLLPQQGSWEPAFVAARRYPDHLNLDWDARELVVLGFEMHTDPEWMQWLAMHPAAAEHLGWVPDPEELFAWRGTDGFWRARTIRRQRGQLSHQAPAAAACAEVWQVILSDIGRRELVASHPQITRTLTVTRTLPANARESRPNDQRTSATALLAEPN